MSAGPDAGTAAGAEAAIAGGGRIVDSGFSPAWWLKNPHLQTLWPVLLRPRPAVAFERERVELADGDFVDVDWCGSGARLALILHGLEGSSRSPYALGLVSTLAARGWRAGVFHFRGCSGSLNRLPRSYHSADTADLDTVVMRLTGARPDRPVCVIGVSLGGNVLLKWLAERGAGAPVTAAAAVSVPFDLAAVAARLERGLSRLYQWHLVSALKEKMRRKLELRPMAIRLQDFENARTLHEFDDRVTAPLHGFADADDYYRRASCGPALHRIARPTLIIQAADDPFMSPGVVPDAGALSAHVTLELSPCGGHVGFVAGAVPGRARYWLERRIPEYLEDVTRDA